MKKGFTLIELLIVITVIGTLAAVFISAVKVKSKKESHSLVGSPIFNDALSVGAPLATSPNNCISGYVVYGGKQLLDDQGHGVKCN